MTTSRSEPRIAMTQIRPAATKVTPRPLRAGTSQLRARLGDQAVGIESIGGAVSSAPKVDLLDERLRRCYALVGLTWQERVVLVAGYLAIPKTPHHSDAPGELYRRPFVGRA